MQNEAFVKLDDHETAPLLDRLNDSLSHIDFKPEKTTILAQELPFYPGYQFLDIADNETMPPLRKFAIYNKDAGADGWEIIDWTPAPFKSLNEKGALKLDEETVLAYVRFYFSYVQGEKGRFIVIESIDDVPWLEEPPPSARKALGKMICAMDAPIYENGSFKTKATLLYRGGLFTAHITVNQDGLVLANRQEILIEDMPVLDDVLGF